MAKTSARGRSLTPPQVVSMLVVFLTLSCVGGVLSAGFAAPFVGATAALTKASAELFEELPSDFNVQPPSQISTLLASDGSEITKFYAENRIVVPLSSISVNMQNAIVAVEDQRFYQHQGVDPTGMVRALVSNNAGGSRQGASTLTQQYVRNTLIETGLKNDDHKLIRDATESTVARKLREMKFALSLEQKYSKQQILEGYLNIAAFSPSTYGVEASSLHYFNKHAKDTDGGRGRPAGRNHQRTQRLRPQVPAGTGQEPSGLGAGQDAGREVHYQAAVRRGRQLRDQAQYSGLARGLWCCGKLRLLLHLCGQ